MRSGLDEVPLNKVGISYFTQQTFNGCIFKSKLYFDFYLPHHRICIEYDGRQHFESVKMWGGDKYLNHQIKLDQIKNVYCENNNIHLIRIPYWDYSNIENILKSYLIDK